MAIKRMMGEKIFDVFNVIFLITISCCFVVPFLHVLFASLSDPLQLARTTGVILWPKGFTIKGYQLVLSFRNIYTGYASSIMYVVVGTLLNLCFTSVIAYVLSRKNVFWNKYIMFIMVFTMFFSGGLIPFYLQIRNLGLYNTRLVMVLPGLVSVYNMIIMRTSFAELPESLAESAKIDGAGHMTILFQIILPISKAMLSVIGLFYAVGHWNAWFNAAIFLQDRDKFPIQLILREILVLGEFSTHSDTVVDPTELDAYLPLIKYATTMIATIPVLLVYPAIQKNFTKGVMIGSIKG